MFRAIATAIAVTLAVAAASAADTDTIEQSGRHFAKTVTVSDGTTEWTLHATGKATRKKLVIKVYAMVHYMDVAEFPSRSDAIAAALDGTHARRIEMEFVRGVGVDKVTHAYRAAFEKHTSSSEYKEIRPLVDQFIGYHTKDVADGDRFAFTAFPGGRVQFTIQGEEKPAIENQTFARALWAIWLGKGSVVKAKDLVKFTAEPKKRRSRGKRR